MSQASAIVSRSICSAPTVGKASFAAADTGDTVGSWQDGLFTTRSVVRRVSISRTAVQVRVEPLPVGAAQAAREARVLRAHGVEDRLPPRAQRARAPPDRCAGRRTRARRRWPDRRRAAAAGWRRGRSSAPSCRRRRPARRARASAAGSAPPALRRCAGRPTGPSASRRAARPRRRTDPALSSWPVSMPPMPFWWPSPPPPFCSSPPMTTRSALCGASGDRIGDSVKSGLAVPVGVQRRGIVPLAENITTKRLAGPVAACARRGRHRLQPGQRDRRAAGAAQDRSREKGVARSW